MNSADVKPPRRAKKCAAAVRKEGVESEATDWKALYIEAEARAQKFGSVLSSLKDGLVVLDSELRYQYVNEYSLQLMGRTKEEVVGKSFRDLYPNLLDTPYYDAMLTALREQRPVEEDIYYPRNGRHWRTIINPSAGGLTVLFRDVTELKATEIAQRRLASIIEWSEDAIIGKTLDGIITNWNPAAESIFGYTADEAIGKPKTILFPPDRLEEETLILSRLAQGIPTGHLETIRVRKDGTPLHVALSISPIKDDTGRIVGASTIARNISDRKALEARLREETETLETIYRLGQRLSAELDLEKLVQFATDACTQLTGAQFGAFFYNVVNAANESYLLYTLSGVPQDTFRRFPLPRNTEVFAPTFTGKGTVRIGNVKEDSSYGKSAPYFGMPAGYLPVTSYLAVPVVSRSGVVLGGLFFGHECADMFTARHERIVEGLAAHTAIAIDNARLFQAERERSEQLATAIREVHHRVKNSLQGVSALLEMQIVPEAATLSVNAIRTSLNQIKTIALVHDLLAYDQPIGTVDVAAVLGKLTSMLTVTMGSAENSIPIHLETIALQLPIKAATALALVVNELVNNAAKHSTPELSADGTDAQSIHVGMEMLGQDVRVTVEDNGPGFPPGFDPARDGHVGLELVQALVTHDLKGAIQFGNRGGSCGVLTDSGTTQGARGAVVTITFPPDAIAD